MTAPTVALRDMSQNEYDAFWARQEREYLSALTDALTADAARIKARQDRACLLPDGQHTTGHRLLSIDNQVAETVGQAWLALRDPQTGSTEVAWLYELRIEDSHRRLGYARAALSALEHTARQLGAQRLGLNVFGHNTAAIALYTDCGYTVTAQQMAKALI